MQSKAKTPNDYMKQLPEDRIVPMTELRKVILKNIPKGFKEVMSYGMIGYVVPHSLYSDGYHCDPKLPLPFICLASQKNFIAFYHMGLYSEPNLLKWYTTEFGKISKTKLDMGKSCTRFKKLEPGHVKLIGELVSKMSVKEWIRLYESKIKVKSKM